MLWQFGYCSFLFGFFFIRKSRKSALFWYFIFLFFCPLPVHQVQPFHHMNMVSGTRNCRKKKRNFQVFGYFIFLKEWNKVALRSEKTGHCFRSPLELLSGRGFSILKGHQDITSRGGRTDLCAWAHILHWDRLSWKLGPARAGSTRTAQVSHTQNILMCSRRNHLKQINWPWDNCGHESCGKKISFDDNSDSPGWGGMRWHEVIQVTRTS